VENTPVKTIPIKKISFDYDRSSAVALTEENEVIEETPIKENELLPSDIMAREIQRLSLRLRSSTPRKRFFIHQKVIVHCLISVYNVPVLDNQPSKPATLHLSQVVNRVSRCNYVLRRFVREAQKFSPKLDEIHRPASQPIPSKPFSTFQSHDSKFIENHYLEENISFKKVDVVYSSILLNRNHLKNINHPLHHAKRVV
jgi:hypothetical protein